MSQIQLLKVSISAFPNPRVVTAAVPNLIPEVTKGDWGSFGTAVPNDPQSPFVTSGIRLGTAAVTTRGFGKAEIETLSNWICDIALDLENTQQINAIKEQVVTMCKRFPVYK